MAPVLYLLRRWQLPFGSVTVLFTVVAIGMHVLNAFQTFPLILPVVAVRAGRRPAGPPAAPLPRQPQRLPHGRRGRALRAVDRLLLPGRPRAVRAGRRPADPPELWTGMIVYNALAGLLLAQLMLAAPTRDAAAA